MKRCLVCLFNDAPPENMKRKGKVFLLAVPTWWAQRTPRPAWPPLLLLCFFLFPLQYALYKKMTQAAILIQSKFRSYYEQKKFQQSRRAAVLIQKFYRSYKKCGRRRQARRTAVIVQQKLRWVKIRGGQENPNWVQRTAPCWHIGLYKE